MMITKEFLPLRWLAKVWSRRMITTHARIVEEISDLLSMSFELSV